MKKEFMLGALCLAVCTHRLRRETKGMKDFVKVVPDYWIATALLITRQLVMDLELKL